MTADTYARRRLFSTAYLNLLRSPSLSLPSGLRLGATTSLLANVGQGDVLAMLHAQVVTGSRRAGHSIHSELVDIGTQVDVLLQCQVAALLVVADGACQGEQSDQDGAQCEHHLVSIGHFDE